MGAAGKPVSLGALPCPQTPGHSALPTAETHASQLSAGARFPPRQPFLGTWRVCGLETQPSVLLTLSVVIPSPLSFLLQGCWENLGLLMSSFLFPNFVMFSGRFSQHYFLTWYHLRVVSSAPALPRLCVSGTRAPGSPTPRRQSSALPVPLGLRVLLLAPVLHSGLSSSMWSFFVVYLCFRR